MKKILTTILATVMLMTMAVGVSAAVAPDISYINGFDSEAGLETTTSNVATESEIKVITDGDNNIWQFKKTTTDKSEYRTTAVSGVLASGIESYVFSYDINVPSGVSADTNVANGELFPVTLYFTGSGYQSSTYLPHIRKTDDGIIVSSSSGNPGQNQGRVDVVEGRWYRISVVVDVNTDSTNNNGRLLGYVTDLTTGTKTLIHVRNAFAEASTMRRVDITTSAKTNVLIDNIMVYEYTHKNDFKVTHAALGEDVKISAGLNMDASKAEFFVGGEKVETVINENASIYSVTLPKEKFTSLGSCEILMSVYDKNGKIYETIKKDIVLSGMLTDSTPTLADSCDTDDTKFTNFTGKASETTASLSHCKNEAGEDGKALKIDLGNVDKAHNTTEADGPYITLASPYCNAPSYFTIEFSAMASSLFGQLQIGIRPYGANGEAATYQKVVNVFNAGKFATSSKTYNANQWYDFKIVYDGSGNTDTATYDLYVEGDPVVTGGAITYRENGTIGASTIRLHTAQDAGKDGSGNCFSIDNINITKQVSLPNIEAVSYTEGGSEKEASTLIPKTAEAIKIKFDKAFENTENNISLLYENGGTPDALFEYDAENKEITITPNSLEEGKLKIVFSKDVTYSGVALGNDMPISLEIVNGFTIDGFEVIGGESYNSVKISAINPDADAVAGKLIIATFNGDRLLGIDMNDISFSENEKADKYVHINKMSGETKVRAFLWNSLTTLTPICAEADELIILE